MTARPARQARIALGVAAVGVAVGCLASLLGQDDWAEWANLGSEGDPPGWVAVSLFAFATAAVAFLWFLLGARGSSGTPDATDTRPGRPPRPPRADDAG